jgi:hypothetical protein
MIHTKRVVLLVLLLIVTTGTAQDNEPEKRFTVEQLNQGFSLLREALEETHTGLKRYVTSQATATMFSTISEKLHQPMTEREMVGSPRGQRFSESMGEPYRL